MNIRSCRLLPALALLLAGALPLVAQAQLTAVSFNTTAFGVGHGGNGVFGWRFTALSNLRIVDVGVFDFTNTHGNGDGLAASHTLAFWDAAAPATPLSASLIPAGTGATLVDGFRYVPVASPTLLLKDHHYVVGATYDLLDAQVSDYNPAPGLVVTIAPDLEFGGYSFTNASGLAVPDHNDIGHYASFGPNFTYTTVTPVPEPSTLPFAIAGGLFFFARHFIKLRRARPLPRTSIFLS